MHNIMYDICILRMHTTSRSMHTSQLVLQLRPSRTCSQFENSNDSPLVKKKVVMMSERLTNKSTPTWRYLRDTQPGQLVAGRTTRIGRQYLRDI